MTSEFQERVDFHVHFKDDSVAVRSLLQEARKSEVVAVGLLGRLALSDQIEDYIRIGEETGVIVYPGVEYSVWEENKLIDLICLAFDPKNPLVRNLFGKQESKAENAKLAQKQKEFLEGRGLIIDPKEIEDKNLLKMLLDGEISEKAINFCRLVAKDYVNRFRINVLMDDYPSFWAESRRFDLLSCGDKKYEEIAKFLYKLYFSQGRAGYVRVQQSSECVVNAVHSGRGVVLYSPEGKFDEIVWNNLLKVGVDGIMGYHGKRCSELNLATALNISRKGLLILGGSDFNPEKNDWQVGVGDGTLHIRREKLFELEKYIAKKYG